MTSGQNGENRGQDAQLHELMQAMRQPGYGAPGGSASSRVARRAKPSRAVRFSREAMVGALAISLLALLMVTTGTGRPARAGREHGLARGQRRHGLRDTQATPGGRGHHHPDR